MCGENEADVLRNLVNELLSAFESQVTALPEIPYDVHFRLFIVTRLAALQLKIDLNLVQTTAYRIGPEGIEALRSIR